MGWYAYYVMASDHDKINELFAKKDPGTRITWGTAGYWEGADATERATAAHRGMGSQSREGKMALHLPICPVIEVAGDGKTARGVWCSPGLSCMKNDETGGGLKHKELPIFVIQYHSEASLGPLDNTYLFDRFLQMVKKAK